MTHNTTTDKVEKLHLEMCGRVTLSDGRVVPGCHIESPALACSALWSRNQAVSCHVTFPHTVHRGSSEPDAPSWGDGECVPGTLTAGRGGR